MREEWASKPTHLTAPASCAGFRQVDHTLTMRTALAHAGRKAAAGRASNRVAARQLSSTPRRIVALEVRQGASFYCGPEPRQVRVHGRKVEFKREDLGSIRWSSIVISNRRH
jgi:hypothetical protein